MSSLKTLEKPKSKNIVKPILDNAFTKQEFPIIDDQTSTSITDFLLHNLKQISSYTKTQYSKGTTSSDQAPPPFYQCLTLGFNPTVAKLESQVKAFHENKEQNTTGYTKYVFVCKSDIKPQLIIQHIPSLVFLSSPSEFKVKLISLPKGTLDKIEHLLGHKISIIGMTDNDIISKDFKELLEKSQDVDVLWLRDFKFQKTKVKMLQTTTPLGKRAKQKIMKKSKNIKRKTP